MIRVKDPEFSLDFYQNVLGMRNLPIGIQILLCTSSKFLISG